MSNQPWTAWSYVTSWLATLAGWALTDWLSLLGFFALLFTTATGFYFRRKERILKDDEWALKKQIMKAQLTKLKGQ